MISTYIMAQQVLEFEWKDKSIELITLISEMLTRQILVNLCSKSCVMAGSGESLRTDLIKCNNTSSYMYF